jgi:hypothetical protein
MREFIGWRRWITYATVDALLFVAVGAVWVAIA